MSMTDRNLRRLLHALKQTNLLESVYLILRNPRPPGITFCDENSIHENAKRYADRFLGSGVSRPTEIHDKLDTMLHELISQEKSIAEQSLRDLGVSIIWVDEYTDIATIMDSIIQ